MKSKLQYRIEDGRRTFAEASLTNEELLQQFPAQCESGKPFIYAAAETETDNARWGGKPVVTLYIAQARTGDFGKNMDADPDAVGYGSFWAKEAGWGTPVVRMTKPVLESLCDKHGWEVGSLLQGLGFEVNIHQKDSLLPANDIESMNPRVTRPNEQGQQFVMVNKANKPIYRRQYLTDGPNDQSPLDSCMDFRASKMTLEVHQRQQQARIDAEAQKAAAEAAQEQAVA